MSDKYPNQNALLDNLGKIAFSLDRAYLPLLSSEYDVIPFDASHGNDECHVDYVDNIRTLQIERWAYKKEEKIGDCLKNVLGTFVNSAASLALVVKRNPSGTKMYFVVKNEGAGLNDASKNNIALLDNVVRGNFQGSVTRIIDREDEQKELFSFKDIETEDGQESHLYSSIAVLTNAPSEYSEDYIGQGLDKLLEGVVPKSEKESYSVVFLAESLPPDKLQGIISGYEDLASAIAPFLSYQFQMGENEAATSGETQSIADTQGISNSIFKTKSVNVGLGSRGGQSSGFGYSWGKSKTISSGITKSVGTSASMSFGTSKSTTYTYKSFMVNNLVDRLEKAMQRLRDGSAIGVWKYSAYIFASDSASSRNVANYLCAITQGKESYVEPSVVQEWTRTTGNDNQTRPFDEIQKYVSHFCHPIFCTKDKDMALTSTSYVVTDQLSNAIAFPRKSVSGLPVYECVPFGREVVLHTADKPEGSDTIPLGNIYHMRTEEKNTPVNLQKDSLTAHTFITGSTGAGKSNAVYTMLNGLCPASNGDESKSHAHFLVIEPAKGEYKDAFGGRGDVSVYGTNPKKTPLLRLNPFSFPEDTHILEHIDRLVEVFNACWPMYAAMPAVLKASIETAYTDCGWDLQMSEYAGKQRSFPTFRDVMKALPKVVDTKGFSNDTQGDYKGALLTRLESLTNGINGQVLCATDEIVGQELFGKNVIVDLSRVGSSETKALLMGILVLKLQEYRMAERAENGAVDNNKGLHHVTVLEEAHNLLRRTSSEQSQEGSNLQGKSVEMLTNAIAEMRTYGEGFIIADQAPGLLDMAVIRNTNTKIILRLPDESDRVLVGKAAGLNDDQIVELSRLDTGVAAVYQNHWLEPVLCKVTEFKKEQQKPFVYKPTDADTLQNRTPYMNVFFGRIVNADPTIGELNAEDVDRLKIWIDNLPVGRNTKLQLLNVLNPEGRLDDLNKGEILYRLANGNDFLKYAGTKTDREAACTAIDQKIMQQLDISRELAEQVRREIFLYAASQIDRERLAAQYAELQKYAELPQRGVR